MCIQISSSYNFVYMQINICLDDEHYTIKSTRTEIIMNHTIVILEVLEYCNMTYYFLGPINFINISRKNEMFINLDFIYATF